MSRSFNFLLQAFLIFLLLISAGYGLSAKSRLCNDEVLTQQYTVEQVSFWDVVAGRFTEGNNFPLFYLIQKAITSRADCQQQIWRMHVSADICMSLSIAVIFLFFASEYSWWWGLYALLMALSSFIVLAYWVQARPYALWFMLTTFQLLILLKLLASAENTRRWFLSLAACHFFLSLTVLFAVIQMGITAMLLWVFQDKRWRKYILVCLLPLAISGYYYMHAWKISFYLTKPVWGMISLSLSTDVVCVALLYAVFQAWRCFKDKQASAPGLAFILLMLVSSIAAAILLKVVTWGHRVGEGFEISFRYCIFLAPLGIIGTIVFAKELFAAAGHDRWIKSLLAVVLAGLLILRGLDAYMLILGWYDF